MQHTYDLYKYESAERQRKASQQQLVKEMQRENPTRREKR